jgi:hypothetical protein
MKMWKGENGEIWIDEGRKSKGKQWQTFAKISEGKSPKWLGWMAADPSANCGMAFKPPDERPISQC